jgi:hypothetical protein
LEALSSELFYLGSFLLLVAFLYEELFTPRSSSLLSNLLFPERFFAEHISTQSIVLL